MPDLPGMVALTSLIHVNISGFMSTGDSNAPGNYALLDHVACLHYLKENIGKTFSLFK